MEWVSAFHLLDLILNIKGNDGNDAAVKQHQ